MLSRARLAPPDNDGLIERAVRPHIFTRRDVVPVFT
jgi:hypothetical protein